MSAAGYQKLEFGLPASAEALLVGELWSAGTLGLEYRDAAGDGLSIVAYFADTGPAARCAARVARSCPGVTLRSRAAVPEADWLAEYRRRARPFALGRGLLVDPGEPRTGSTITPPPGRRLLRLPARRAFGTGEHASTRLVVEWLEALDLAGQSVLDVGCGSGILSLAAVLSGAGPVVAVEIDPVAAWVARDGQRLNGLGYGLVAGRAACLRRREGFDLLLVNVLPERIRPDLTALRGLLATGGRALFSGLLDESGEDIENQLAASGFAPVARRRLDGWRAVLTTGGRVDGESC